MGDEKIDIIAYQEDPAEFIKAALSPAKELQVKVNEKEKTAQAIVPDDQLSLAIGKEGQNVRLAAKLTGYKIDIRGKSGTPKEVEAKGKKAQEEAKKALGVVEEVSKVPEVPKVSKAEKKEKSEDKTAEPEEKGTAEKSSAKDDPQAALADDQSTASQAQDQPDKIPEEPKELEAPESENESVKTDDGDKIS